MPDVGLCYFSWSFVCTLYCAFQVRRSRLVEPATSTVPVQPQVRVLFQKMFCVVRGGKESRTCHALHLFQRQSLVLPGGFHAVVVLLFGSDEVSVKVHLPPSRCKNFMKRYRYRYYM